MRRLYSLAIYLITPLALLHLVFRGLRNRDYLRRWSERFARFEAPDETGGIIVHAVSVGEVNAASPLVRALAKMFPDLPLTLTTFTPTGSDRIRALYGDSYFHVYAPIDLPGAVRRFFDRLEPRLLVIMETEIWPNLYFEAARRGIPVMIANARISDQSISGYRRLRTLTGAALRQVARIAAQSELDAVRLIDIGADPDRVEVTGNLKFDVKLPPGLSEQGESMHMAWGVGRQVLVAGSTHEGDEPPVLEAFSKLLKTFPDALLILVPRHPERFARAAQLAKSAHLRVSMRSDGLACPGTTQCFIIDTMGELINFYAACDVAFVGGSLDTIGGHNVLEPAALAKPVLVGPHTFNFEDITEQLLDAGAAIRVADTQELERAVSRLFSDADMRDRMGRTGQELVLSGKGALARTLEIAEELL
jgi:3-deoxy-D-manno-octulosonic-acid transferase